MTDPDGRAASREQRVADTFVALAAGLVDDYDVVEVLDRLVSACLDLLSVSAAGIVLDDEAGLTVVAAANEDLRLLEVFQFQHDEGPCFDAARSATLVVSADLEAEHDRWPAFAPAALEAGFRAVTAVPLRLHRQGVGSLGLFRDVAGVLPPEDERLAQAFADVATVGILQQRSLHQHSLLADQLRVALDSRVLIEQAKGVLSVRRNVSMADAFLLLRQLARDRNLKLTTAAVAVIEGRLESRG